MIRSVRAELLVLRKRRVVLALVLLTPLLTLLSDYVVQYLYFRTADPSQYSSVGSPDQVLPTILPSQFLIVAVSHFGFQGTAVFVVLGALIAGSSWEQGTFQTGVLQEGGRLRTLAGQTVAVLVALALSVVLVFTVAAVSAGLVALRETGSLSPVTAPFPAVTATLRALSSALLIAFTYGAAGIALGTALRRARSAIAVSLVWTVFLQGFLDDLALQAQGVFATLNDALPNASALSLTDSFGAVGGGANVAMYSRLGVAASCWILLAYTCASLTFAALLVRSRDVSRAPSAPLRLGSGTRRAVTPAPPVRGALQSRRSAGLWGAVRSELVVLSRWRTAQAFLVVTPLYALMNSYGVQALLYATAGTGIQRGLSPDSILPAMLPPESVAVALRTFGPDLGFDGTVPFVLLGALVAGSSWSGGTVRTAFLQGPSRAHVVLGQVAALGFAFLAVTVATFTICVGASALAAMTTTQPSESIGPFPTTAAIGTGLGSALLVSICYGSIGFALGTLTRSASGAIGGALLWSITLQTNVTAMAGQLGGAARAIDGLLPFASVQTLTGLLNDSSTAVLPTPLHVQPSAAVLVLLTWLTASIAMCVLVSNARDIT